MGALGATDNIKPKNNGTVISNTKAGKTLTQTPLQRAQAAAASRARSTTPNGILAHAADKGVLNGSWATRTQPGGGTGGGGTGGGGGGGSYGGGGGSYAAPAVQSVPTEQDYLAGDDIYQNTVGALKRALGDYESQYRADQGTYNQDYDNGLKNLGYTPGQGEGGKGGEWNWTDPLTASGRAREAQTNDFASRGMVQSQGYYDAFETLKRSLGDQFTNMLGAKTKYQGDLDRGLTEYKSQNTLADQSARTEAIQRMAALYGLV